MNKTILLCMVVFISFFNVLGLNITDDTIADLVEKVAPAVVNIDTVVYVKNQNPVIGFNDPFLERFFGGDFNPRRNNVIPQEGIGTGFIISEKGYIVTNAHVIQSKDAQVKITFSDDTKIDGAVVGLDKTNDVAVIKFEPEKVKDFKVLEFGKSEHSRIGNWVIAIGSPFGLQKTVTSGIISALNRNLPIDRETVMQGLIQTDASINPGNSGGPLLNMKGEVIGINTAIIPMGQGLGFAIPSERAKPIIDEIIKYGKHIYPSLGVYLTDMNYRLLKYYDIEGGSIIAKIVKDSPAEKAGLKEGDIVTMIDKQKILRTSQLITYIRSKKIGDKVFITILRDGDKKILKAVLGGSKDEEQIVKEEIKKSTRDIGITFYEKANKVIVRDVDPKSDAYYQGVKKGDVVKKVDGKIIKNIDQIYDILNKAEENDKKQVFMLTESSGFFKYVIIDL